VDNFVDKEKHFIHKVTGITGRKALPVIPSTLLHGRQLNSLRLSTVPTTSTTTKKNDR
jgi:hypothetical protein